MAMLLFACGWIVGSIVTDTIFGYKYKKTPH